MDGIPNEIAVAILDKIPATYVEISPSGRGLHIFLRGAIPRGGNKNSESGVEMYSSKRYFTVTGNRWKDCADEIAVDNGCIKWIFDTYIKPKSAEKLNNPAANQGFSTLTDEQVLEAAREARDAVLFGKLWRGEWSGKYKSQSEADFALCCKLAFWCNHDLKQMDRLFRKSDLFREKWTANHNAEGETYGETTLRRACEKTPETYNPKQKKNVAVFEQDGCYYCKHKDSVKQLSNFIIIPIDMVKSDEEAQLVADFIIDDGEKIRRTFMASDFASLAKFKTAMNNNSISICYSARMASWRF